MNDRTRLRGVSCLAAALVFSRILVSRSAAQDSLPLGDAVIRAAVGHSEIVITTTARVAGAIHSLT
jgi:hypothetical protein